MKKTSKVVVLTLLISLLLGSLSLASGMSLDFTREEGFADEENFSWGSAPIGEVEVEEATLPLEKDRSIIGVMVNYRHLQFDQNPVVIGGRTLVPVAAIFKELGLSVLWDAETRTVVGSTYDEGLVITITLDSKTAYINGEEIQLQTPATAINGRTMVPVRFIAEATGATVDWDAEEKLVSIKTPGTGSYEDMFHEEVFYEDEELLTEEELSQLAEEE